MYALGYAINGKLLFSHFDIKKLKTPNNIIKNYTKSLHKDEFANKIFMSALELIMQDIIENSITFDFKLYNNRTAELYIKEFPKELFIKGLKNGKWADVDYLSTNFSAYAPMFKYAKAGYIVEKPIYLNKKYKDRLISLVNSGKAYY